MKFEILTDRFERRKERTAYGTIPLRRRADGRDFFLKETAAALLELPAGIHDFDECFGAYGKSLRQDLSDGLTLLSAFGAAAVVPEQDSSACVFRVAGERDYADIAGFVNSGRVFFLGSLAASDDVMSMDAIRARQFNNLEYCFLYREQGELKGVLIAGMPSEESWSTACRLCGIVLSDEFAGSPSGLLSSDGEKAVRGLLDCTEEAFRGDMGIFRYLCLKDDDPFLPFLKDEGFQETAFLRHELADGGDVRIYDRRIGTC